MSRSRDLGDVGSKANFLDNVSTDLGDFSGQSIPHIIPDVLYPAVEGKDLAGVAFSGSYVYGTAHTDGRKYFYTSIKGSRPIHDPRVGSHFGAQRHKFKSVQLLEQETATHGKKVYSVDGREYIRASGDGDITILNNADSSNGQLTLPAGKNAYIEIVGYFSDVSVISYNNNNRDLRYTLDNATEDTTDYGSSSAGSPLTGRYVDSGGLTNFGLGATLGIHTIKITSKEASENVYVHGIELIAQDTTSTANRSKIQIPSQNVVSYGKKFNVSGTPHYDPFSAKTDGSAWTSPTSGSNTANSSASWSTNIDTATSLGLSKWVDGSNYYRPYNGARVVHWVDNSGTIKTSVTVMPPNAKSIKSADINKKAKNAPNDTYLPTFEDETTDINEDNLHEVAKTFHFREFGNGSANGNATYADASMLNTTDDIAYVMDDGTTSLSGYQVENGSGHASQGGSKLVIGPSEYIYLTFIGTGISSVLYDWSANLSQTTIAQNLPYGTHILKINRASNNDMEFYVDGVLVYDVNQGLGQQISAFTFHQPKMPPISPEAVIISDYCLLADFVPQTNGDLPHISKGVRYCSASRDSFIDGNSATSTKFFQNVASGTGGFQISLNQNGYTLSEGRIVGFGHSFGVNFMRDTDRMTDVQARLDGSNYTYNSSDIWDTDTIWDDTNDDGTLTKSGSTAQEVYGIKNQTLGLHTFGDKTTTNPSANKFNDWIGWQIATPIHTSHHYQSFESHLHELIGGDRNMEQTHLVCSPDGRTWDQLTRDTSYLGNNCIMTTTDSGSTSASTIQVFDEWRGEFTTGNPAYNKDFAIAYDRVICLKDGFYHIHAQTIKAGSGDNDHVVIVINGNDVLRGHASGSNRDTPNTTTVKHLKRGDFLQIKGFWYGSFHRSQFFISRVN